MSETLKHLLIHVGISSLLPPSPHIHPLVQSDHARHDSTWRADNPLQMSPNSGPTMIAHRAYSLFSHQIFFQQQPTHPLRAQINSIFTWPLSIALTAAEP